ncbi:MAG: collagenase [Bacteroidota bacterium]
MLRNLKKITISLGSILGLGMLFWIILLMNPSLSYAHQTKLGKVDVYHEQALPAGSEALIAQAYEILKTSEIFSKEAQIQLCLNDGSNFPHRFPLRGGVAYSYWNKAIIYKSNPDFIRNRAFYEWEENQGAKRSWDLVELLAHEFTHTLQSYHNRLSPLEDAIWKIEGYAEYISRSQRKELRDLKENLRRLRDAQKQASTAIPWINFQDGSGVPQSYFRYRLLIQYLLEEKGLSYLEILDMNLSDNEVEEEIISYLNLQN